jgi:hypothetical protein
VTQQEQEFKIKDITIRVIRKKFVPINLDYEVVDHMMIEIYQNRLLRPSKLLKRTKYNVSPAMTIEAFLSTLDK